MYDIIDVSLCGDIEFNMSKVGLIKESDESIGDIPLVPLNLSHISYDNGFKVHANGSKITITHDLFDKIIKLIVANIAISFRYDEFSSHLSGYFYFLISDIFFVN